VFSHGSRMASPRLSQGFQKAFTRCLQCVLQDVFKSACSVAATYKPPMLAPRVRLLAGASHLVSPWAAARSTVFYKACTMFFTRLLQCFFTRLSLRGGSLRGGSLSRGSLRGGSLRGGSLRGGSLRGGSLRGGSLRGGSVRGGSLRGGSLRGGSRWFAVARGDSRRFALVRGGSRRFAVVRGGSRWLELDLARLG
jgi:hypothetical protein